MTVHSLGSKAKIASLAALLLLATCLSLVIYELHGWGVATGHLLRDYRRSLVEGEFHEAITRATGEIASYLQTGDTGYRSEAADALARARDALTELRDVVLSERRDRDLHMHGRFLERQQRLLESMESKLALTDRALAMPAGTPAADLLPQIYADEAEGDELLFAVNNHHRAEREQHERLVGTHSDRARLLVLVGALAMLLWIGLLVRYVRRRVVDPLTELVGFTSSVSAGDLSRRIAVTRRDEIGQLQHSFNQLTIVLAAQRAQVSALVESLSTSRDAAQAANRAKSEFVARVSHEIRTPMNAVIVSLDLLHETAPNPERRDLAELARTGARSLLGMLNDLLDLSRIESGKLALDSVPFTLHDLLGQMIELQAQRGRAKGLALRCEISPKVPCRLRGDPMRLGQVALNLIDNAIKYTEHGSILVTVAPLDASGPAVGATGGGAREVRLQFCVIDTGIGIPPAMAGRIFEPFFQAHSPAGGQVIGKAGGFGLGLGIARQLSRMMGGDLDYESTPGQGTTFRFTVRLQVETQSESGAAAPAQRPPLPRGKRVLLAEDHGDTREVMQRMLERRNIEVVTAEDGRRAVELACETRFDLVLMDCQMPVMDGFEATAQIRALSDGHARVPIVALTAYGLSGGMQDYRAAGFDDLVPKPYTVEQIEEALYRWLGPRDRDDGTGNEPAGETDRGPDRTAA